MEAKTFYNFYYDNGFNFSPDILTRYCLSLYTKPFVILSGISGTGKTKIAQLFNLPVAKSILEKNQSEKSQDVPKQKEWITLTFTQGILEDGRGNLPYSSLEAIYEKDEIDDINIRIKELIEQKRDDNITDPSDIVIIDTTTGVKIPAQVYLQRASSPLVRIRFKSKRGEPSYDSRQYFADHFKIGSVLSLRKVGKRIFEIVSIDDIELIQISKQVRIQEQGQIENTLFTSVKSDWTDASAITGFFNLVTQLYYVPPVLKFILRAKENPEMPFFLILDEMNLSKVEHYFSDILSCMESRFIINKTELRQEKIVLHGAVDVLETDDIEFDLIPSRLEIPLNLYITGTVNIDESTYMFSPKVLDRANVIEFNDVDLSTYDKDQHPKESKFILNNFPLFGKSSLATREHYRNAPDKVKVVLKELLDLLRQYNLHFGYRVINEFSHFVLNCTNFIGSSDDTISQTIDIQIIQKILPKFNGSFNKLDEPIRKLIEYLSIADISFENVDIEFLNKIDYSKELFPLSLKKLSIMYGNLINNGFVSFIE